MQNNLQKANQMLFDQLERLNNPNLKGEEMQNEMNRTESMSKVTGDVCKIANICLNAATLISSGTVIGSKLPEVIGMKNAKQLS